MKRTTADAIQKTAKQISQARRKASLQKRKDYIQSLPDAPPLICLSELAEKTQLPFQMLTRTLPWCLVRPLKPLILLVPKIVLPSLKMKPYVKHLNKSNWQIINMKFQPLV